MPFTTTEIQNGGKAVLDFHIKNKPIDQIQTDRPWVKQLMKTARTFPGAKQYVTEQLRKTYGSNFQWYFGAQLVTYNSRQTLDQAQFSWSGAHDGFYLDEDRLLQHGIKVSDDRKQSANVPSEAERMQLTNLLTEETEALRLGFEEKFDYELHLDGTQDTEAVAGLEFLLTTDTATTTSGTVGGIAWTSSSNTWWANNSAKGLTSGTILATMEKQWRKCTRNGGRPNFLLCGQTYLDTYVAALRAAGTGQYQITGVPKADGGFPVSGSDGLFFKGVPMIYDPVMADLDAALSPTIAYENRCYMLNMRHLRLRPAEGHNMVTRKPPREYNRYVFYWAITWKGALTINRRNAHSVLSV